MVMSPDAAARKYQIGVDAVGGATAYINCGQAKDRGFLAVAECMQGLKRAAATTAGWAAKYRAAAAM